MTPLRCVLMFAAAAGIAPFPAANAATTSKPVAAFCSANPDLDFPDRVYRGAAHGHDALPPEVASVGATNWRCRDGKVYVCAGGASGSACQKMDSSRQPSKAISETCADDRGQDFVATAVIGNSSSTWRCRGTTPEIIKTVPLDRSGFMQQTWAPLFDTRGNIDAAVELQADPR
jgi:hypothetical protein